MKFAYKFSNLLGSIYQRGNIAFIPDGNGLISPVGNRINYFDLKNNKSSTISVESSFNYTTIALSPNGCTLVAVNEIGEAHLISLISKTIVHRFVFKKRIRDVKFSPDGKHIAFCKENMVVLFKAPGEFTGEFNTFVTEKVFHGAGEETTCIDWSFDSKMIAIGSQDMSVRIYTLEKCKNYKNTILGTHTQSIKGCFFEKDTYDMITVSRNGEVCVWECGLSPSELILSRDARKIKKMRINDDEKDLSDSNDKVDNAQKEFEDVPNIHFDETSKKDIDKLFYRRNAKHIFGKELKKENHLVTLSAVAYQRNTKILVTAFSTGSFFIHEAPEMNLIHSLSISEQPITGVSINSTGDWIALGCAQIGQLLVWEWQSETYVMKQQGHSMAMSCISYSADGLYLASGGQDGKLKLWDINSGFCFVTFEEHAAPITGVAFSYNKKFVVSSSLDGTIRAYDITRYRNFRTLTTPRPVQLSCVSVDYSGDLVAAGGQDVFEIFLWSIKRGKLLEVLAGHEGPVCSLSFSPSPTSSCLASVSWDKTLRVWNALENGSQHETIDLTSDGLAVTFNPNGEEVAVATLDGQISFFHIRTATQTQNIEGRNDLGSGRIQTDLVSAKKSKMAKAFTSICYSADGEYILAGGQSKNVCIYNVKEGLIVKKFIITQNRSLDGVDDFVNRRSMVRFGNSALIEEREPLEGGNVAIKLPGTKKGDAGERTLNLEIRVYALQFSPSGDTWAVASTEGLLVYSLNKSLVFDPWELDLEITPDSIKKAITKNDFSSALMMAIRLNEGHIIKEVMEKIKTVDIELIVASLPETYLDRILRIVAIEIESSRHFEFYLRWSTVISKKANNKNISSATLLAIYRSIKRKQDQLIKIVQFNKYTSQVLLKIGDSVKGLNKMSLEENSNESNDSDDYSDDNLMEVSL